jgi:hypothetical protein
LYVDDLLIAGSNADDLIKFKASLMLEFEMSDLGNLSYFLGMKFVNILTGVFLHQKKFANDILKKFGMRNCNPAITPKEIGAKLSKDRNDEPVNATLYKSQCGII